MAADLQIRRTPLKEAILAMEREGFVMASAGRGHVVTPLSRREVEDAYPLLMAYEALIIARYPPDEVALDHMANLNAELRETTDPYRRLELDEAFHATIGGSCTNQRLLYSRESLELVIRRYSSRYPLRAFEPERSVAEHEAIVTALSTADTAKALRALERHWDECPRSPARRHRPRSPGQARRRPSDPRSVLVLTAADPLPPSDPGESN